MYKQTVEIKQVENLEDPETFWNWEAELLKYKSTRAIPRHI